VPPTAGGGYLCALLQFDMVKLSAELDAFCASYQPRASEEPPKPWRWQQGSNISDPTHILVPVTSVETPRSDACAQTASEALPVVQSATACSEPQQTSTPREWLRLHADVTEAWTCSLSEAASAQQQQQTSKPREWLRTGSEASSVADASEFDAPSPPGSSHVSLLNSAAAAAEVTLPATLCSSSIESLSDTIIPKPTAPSVTAAPPSSAPSAPPPSAAPPSEPPSGAPSAEQPSAAPLSGGWMGAVTTAVAILESAAAAAAAFSPVGVPLR
jgi:hypothetical protein